MRYLITGGAGFIGSHLAEALLARGDRVAVLDDLSTGGVENIRHLKINDKFHCVFDSIQNRHVLAEMVDECDVVLHLAAAVGVRLIVESPVRTIETNVHGTQLVLDAACKKKKLVFLASTSEVYGKAAKVPFREDDDLVLGPTSKGRWSYAASKALDEFLALAYWKEKTAAGGGGPFLQHDWTASNRAVWHGVAEFRESGAGRKTAYGFRERRSVALFL